MRPFLKKNLRNVEPLQVKNLLAYYKEGCKTEMLLLAWSRKAWHFQANNNIFWSQRSSKFKKMIEELGWKISKQEENYLLRLKRCGSF